MPPVLGIAVLAAAGTITWKVTPIVVRKVDEALQPVHHYFKYKA